MMFEKLQDNPFYQCFFRLWNLYRLGDNATRRRMILAQVITTLIGFTALFLVAVVTFIIVLLSNPDILQDNRYLHYIYSSQSLVTKDNFLAASSIFLVIAFILAILFRLFANLILLRLTAFTRQFYTEKVLKNALNMEYEYTLNRSPDGMLMKSRETTSAVVSHAMLYPPQLVAHTVSGLVVFGVLLAVQPLVGVLLVAVLSLSYLLVYRATKTRIRFYGKRRYEIAQDRLRVLRQGFSGYMEVFFLNKGTEYINSLNRLFKEELRIQLKTHLVESLPGHFIRMTTIGLLFAVGIYVVFFSDIKEGITSIIIFIGASTRILPVIGGFYNVANQTKLDTENYVRAMEDLDPDPQIIIPAFHTDKPRTLKKFECVSLEHVDYVYPGQKEKTLSDISMEVKAGEMVVLSGRSGAGKTTVAKLCCALFQPHKGEMRANHQLLDNFWLRRQWYDLIGYIPQKPFFSNDTIAANVAFELDYRKIDEARVQEALEQVQLYEFISGLPHGIHASFGDNEARLSGGQAQRLAIARSLYRKSELLVMDEATNALDAEVSFKVMQAIKLMVPKKALLVISHSSQSTQLADRIYLLDYGEIVAQGGYDELLEKSDLFRSLMRHYTKDDSMAKQS